MRRAAMASLLFVVLMLGVGACGGGPNQTGAGGTGGEGTQTCQSIRLCALDCSDDACVSSTCKPRGTSEAQSAFQALRDCTRTTGGCAAPSDLNCLCAAQCLQDPPCALELDACVGVTSDPICEVNCH